MWWDLDICLYVGLLLILLLSSKHYIKHFGTFGSPKYGKYMYCAHEHITSLGECGNIEVGTHECPLVTWERLHGNIGTSAHWIGNVCMGTWEHSLEFVRMDFHVHLLNTRRVHLFLALHIKFAILTWCWIYNTPYWTGQQTLKIIFSLPLRTSWIHRVNDIGTINM